MSAGEIVKAFRIPRATLYWLAKRGEIPYHELPREPWHRRRRLVFDPAEVAAALKRLGNQSD